MKEKRILDIGCGHNPRGNYGIDKYVDLKSTKDFHFKKWDVENGLPYPDNFFDKIISYSVLEHLHNPVKFIQECYRVLKYGGEIEIEAARVSKNFWDDDPTHVRPYTKNSLRRLLEDYTEFKITFLDYTKKTTTPILKIRRISDILTLPGINYLWNVLLGRGFLVVKAKKL